MENPPDLPLQGATSAVLNHQGADVTQPLITVTISNLSLDVNLKELRGVRKARRRKTGWAFMRLYLWPKK